MSMLLMNLQLKSPICFHYLCSDPSQASRPKAGIVSPVVAKEFGVSSQTTVDTLIVL